MFFQQYEHTSALPLSTEVVATTCNPARKICALPPLFILCRVIKLALWHQALGLARPQFKAVPELLVKAARIFCMWRAQLCLLHGGKDLCLNAINIGGTSAA